jgi:hypothetical protein
MALNVMQKETSNGSPRGKFKRAAWNSAYLAKLLAPFRNAIALLMVAMAIAPSRYPLQRHRHAGFSIHSWYSYQPLDYFRADGLSGLRP